MSDYSHLSLSSLLSKLHRKKAEVNFFTMEYRARSKGQFSVSLLQVSFVFADTSKVPS